MPDSTVAAAGTQYLCGLSPEAVDAHFRAIGEPQFRAAQVLDWFWVKHASSYDRMSNLPKPLRQRLAAELPLSPLALVDTRRSADATTKLLSRLPDGSLVESVLICAPRRLTGCISSQVGCALRCAFCASGLEGLLRNLTAAEITGQVQLLEQVAGDRLGNLVFMGMGEPLHNLDAALAAIDILNHPRGAAIGARKITLSTSGLVPGIARLARDTRQVRLSVSLHAATDEVRDRLMPVNRRYPLAALIAACRRYQEATGRMITFEYVLLDDVNCSAAAAAALVRLLRGLRCKLNLIPYNSVAGLPYRRPALARQRSFLQSLLRSGIPATLRREKGHEISAACGQLRLQKTRGGESTCR